MSMVEPLLGMVREKCAARINVNQSLKDISLCHRKGIVSYVAAATAIPIFDA
ncbi:hypothetical protein QTH91_15935 [Variovorax dokdonensis]|uniref:Uncharacterized protein n=1 Tax=Variovorax dokdonensis TaxID=344883 RepID=A0ABT7NDF8_9BURK|nr:hypothetical protein [Variovorax dokdonensis]MDM0045979.1 hypothetical protein [Variovorax dokdonensis]